MTIQSIEIRIVLQGQENTDWLPLNPDDWFKQTMGYREILKYIYLICFDLVIYYDSQSSHIK